MDYLGNKDLYQQVTSTNIVPCMQIGGMFDAGKYVDTDDKKLHRFKAMQPDTPWIVVNPNPELLCMIYKEIEQGCNFIPSRCMECWKIVVMPRSFHELMQLLDIQEKLVKDNPRCWCKCGVEMRDFVPRDYGGYFYTSSLEQGKIRYDTVREKVSEVIGVNVPVVLKRYCTEFELKYGPSDIDTRPAFAEQTEKLIWETIDIENAISSLTQPEWMKKNIIQQWMIFAHGRGDDTVRLYNNGAPLFTPPMTYHEESL